MCYTSAMTVNSLIDITGANATVQLKSTPGTKARHIYLTPIGGAVRWGNTSTGAGTGNSIPAGVQHVLRANEADVTDLVDLSTVYVYVPTGVTLTISYS